MSILQILSIFDWFTTYLIKLGLEKEIFLGFFRTL